jgi:hypothetical protein
VKPDRREPVERNVPRASALPPYERGAKTHPLLAAVVGMIVTPLFGCVCFLGAFLIFDWAGGSFGGLGAVGREPDGWALPAWLALTATLLTVDVWVIRRAYRGRASARGGGT